MPVVYRTPPWLLDRRKKLDEEGRASSDTKPVSMVGAGRGGSLIAFSEASGVARQ